MRVSRRCCFKALARQIRQEMDESINELNWWKLRHACRDEEDNKFRLQTNLSFDVVAGNAVGKKQPSERLLA